MKNSAFAKLLKYAMKYKFSLAVVIVAAAVEVFASLFSVYLVGVAIDAMEVGNVNVPQLVQACWEIAALIALYIASEWLMEVFSSGLTYNVVRDIRRDVFDNIQKVPLSYVDNNRTGELLSRMVVDVEQISDGLLMSCTQLFSGVFTIVATLAIMMVIDWKVGLVVVGVTPVSMLVALYISKRTHKHFKKQSEIRGEVTSKVEEAVNAQTLFKTFGYQQRGYEQFAEVNAELEKTAIKATFFSSVPNPAMRAVNNIVYMLIGLVGALTIINAKAEGVIAALTVGQLTALLTYALKYAKPFNAITDVITEVESAIASAERVFAVSGAEREPSDGNLPQLSDVDGSVRLADVGFAYNKDVPLIENFNLDVKPGQTIAIVGRTGCGKTTLINLLMRFYDVDNGNIYVSGKDVRQVTRNSLRGAYGMVLQDSYVFSGTIRHNIAFGKEATDEEIVEAAKRAHAWSFIKRLPDGLDTEVGENSNLSEGQKQLLCIARAMLHLPNMLILDEATSSVDTRTEVRIQRAFDEMMRGRTCFVVAHRLSTIRKADCIVVMDKGHIVEQGTHDQLLAKGGFYAELYNSQFEQAT